MDKELRTAIRNLMESADRAADYLQGMGDNQYSSVLYQSVEKLDALVQRAEGRG